MLWVLFSFGNCAGIWLEKRVQGPCAGMWRKLRRPKKTVPHKLAFANAIFERTRCLFSSRSSSLGHLGSAFPLGSHPGGLGKLN